MKDPGQTGERTWRIGEVAAMLQMETSALRFWEKEFPQIAPVRTPRGQRLYRESDIQILRRVRDLLYSQGLTIEGARKALAQHGEPPEQLEPELLATLRERLLELRGLLTSGKLI